MFSYFCHLSRKSNQTPNFRLVFANVGKMLGMDLNMPVTLVVKAPNQKFGDLTVECALGWTIRKLKEHLATVYPNKPVSNLDRKPR